MQINLDCLKDVLLYCVNNIDYIEKDNTWDAQSVNLAMMYRASELGKYEKKDIMRSVLKLKECSFIKISTCFPENKPYLKRCSIEDITISGYQFINSVKEPSIWEKTKSIANKLGNHMLGFIEGVAHDIAVESAKQAVTIMMTQNTTS